MGQAGVAQTLAASLGASKLSGLAQLCGNKAASLPCLFQPLLPAPQCPCPKPYHWLASVCMNCVLVLSWAACAKSFIVNWAVNRMWEIWGGGNTWAGQGGVAQKGAGQGHCQAGVRLIWNSEQLSHSAKPTTEPSTEGNPLVHETGNATVHTSVHSAVG